MKQKILFIEVEGVDELLTHFDLYGAVEADVGVAVEVEELFEEVQHFCHLGEDQDF